MNHPQIGKEEVPDSRRSKRGYIRTYSRLKREDLLVWILNRWVFSFCSAVSHCGVSFARLFVQSLSTKTRMPLVILQFLFLLLLFLRTVRSNFVYGT